MTVITNPERSPLAIPSTDMQSGGVRGTIGRTSIIVYLFVLSMVIPNYFYAGPLRLTPFLLILLVAFVPMCLMWIIGYAKKPVIMDYLILLYCVWASIALVNAHGLEVSLEPIGIIFAQTFGSYLVGRLFIQNAKNLTNFVLLAAIILTLIFPLTLYENLRFRSIYLELFAKLGPTHNNFFMEPRWGLNRVQGPFEHPILFGIFCSSIFALVFYSFQSGPLRHLRLIFLPVIGASSFISLSTGALLTLIVQGGLIAWDIIFRSDPKRWQKLIILVVIGYVTVDLISNRTPFNVFVDYATFNSGSAYNRILIWKFGTAEVWRHPLLGIGLNEWVRPWYMSSSMDNFWLVQAVRYGLPAFLLMSIGFFLIVYRAGKAPLLREIDDNMRKGLLISLVGVFFGIASVHLWNATFCWLMFLIGSAVWLTRPSDSADVPTTDEKEPNQNSFQQENTYAPNLS